MRPSTTLGSGPWAVPENVTLPSRTVCVEGEVMLAAMRPMFMTRRLVADTSPLAVRALARRRV